MAFNIPPTLSDELSAVNVLLSSIGESPVSSLDGEASEAASAQLFLEEQSRAVQSRGWPWNRDYGVLVAVDSTGRCPMPDNALRIAKAYPGDHSGSLTERKRFVYDNRRSSFIFDEGVMLDLISFLQFDEMPEAARRYVTILAAQQYQGRIQTSGTVDRILDSQVLRALQTLEEEVDEVEQNNMIGGNADTQSSLRGRGGVRRRY